MATSSFPVKTSASKFRKSLFLHAQGSHKHTRSGSSSASESIHESGIKQQKSLCAGATCSARTIREVCVVISTSPHPGTSYPLFRRAILLILLVLVRWWGGRSAAGLLAALDRNYTNSKAFQGIEYIRWCWREGSSPGAICAPSARCCGDAGSPLRRP
jgi:hypothetical protein